jgi:hypothetical protein
MSKSRRYAIVQEQFFFLLNIISNIPDNAQWVIDPNAGAVGGSCIV